jgi:uncharacterized protein (DUF1810 family)
VALERFKQAQDDSHCGFVRALEELQSGQKTSHWIWYIFPQLTGLGHSSLARHYAIKDLDEACEYLCDPILRDRLQQTTQAVADQLAKGVRLTDLMGSRIDALKLVSSLTLFQLAADRLAASEGPKAIPPLAPLFADVLAVAAKQGFAPCAFTLSAGHSEK